MNLNKNGKKTGLLLHKSGSSKYNTYHFVCVSNMTSVEKGHEVYTDTQKDNPPHVLSPCYSFKTSNPIYKRKQEYCYLSVRPTRCNKW